MTEIELVDRQGYLDKMAKPLPEKLRIARYLPPAAAHVLDVGCADGAVTRALARLFPATEFLGIDLDHGFVDLANEQAAAEQLNNVKFERVYLRELLARAERFDAVTFCSVLHEFFTYGEGISSVLKALADAHELLRPGGVIVIRDMVLHEYARHATYGVEGIRRKLEARLPAQVIADFTRHYGPLDRLAPLNHLLLKYWYAENWARECSEYYVPVTFEDYAQVFRLLGMTVQVMDSTTLPFLREKWWTDFELTVEELDLLRSTGSIVAQKPAITPAPAPLRM